MIGLVTDSNAQLPPALRDRYGVEVVPLTVTVDGTDFAEGIDLDADGFYARFTDGAPTVSTSQPSPGRFAEAYTAAAARGATEILSIHIGSALSGTLNSARIAAASSPVPVRLVDTGTASFGIACCVWEAGEALGRGASIDDASAIAETMGAKVDNVFVVQALDLVRAGGRLAVETTTTVAAAEAPAIPVLTLAGGEVRALGAARDADEAAQVMADHIVRSGDPVKVAIGIADAAAAPCSTALEKLLADHERVREIVHYRVGPSVGVHTGPGTAGAFFYAVT